MFFNKISQLLLLTFIFSFLGTVSFANNSTNFNLPTFDFANCNNGGTIGSNQTICFGEDPAEILNINSADGGAADIEYMWMQSVPGVSGWNLITTATSESYDPGPLSQTTAFMRCARRTGYTNYTCESNVVLITVNPAPSIFFTAADCLLFEFETGTYSVPSNPTYTFFWNFGDGSTASNTNSVTHNYSEGAYTLTVTATDNMTGCSNTISKDITVLNSALPVELSAFDLEIVNNDQVRLNWTTISEFNNSHFEVQYSADGDRFQTIGIVDGAGTTNEEKKYTLTHDSPLVGENYYRLNQVDTDGHSTFSSVMSISLDKEDLSAISIYPNPVSSDLTLKLKESSDSDIQISIFDQNHKLVLETEIPANNIKMVVPVNRLAPGIYVVKVKAREYRTSMPMIKID